jgi:hypothetical protein
MQQSESFDLLIRVHGMGNPTKMELSYVEGIMKNSQASLVCNAEVPGENLA